MTPLLSTSQRRRRRRVPDALLREVLASVDDAPIYEQQIRSDEFFVFGSHDTADGSVTLNTPLLRVLVALHELTHRVRPGFTEQGVRARSHALLQMLDDDGVAAIDDRLVAAIRSR
jgi:hypothetical protein